MFGIVHGMVCCFCKRIFDLLEKIRNVFVNESMKVEVFNIRL